MGFVPDLALRSQDLEWNRHQERQGTDEWPVLADLCLWPRSDVPLAPGRCAHDLGQMYRWHRADRFWCAPDLGQISAKKKWIPSVCVALRRYESPLYIYKYVYVILLILCKQIIPGGFSRSLDFFITRPRAGSATERLVSRSVVILIMSVEWNISKI